MSRPLILVADDEQDIRDWLSEGLDRHGFDVLLAADGREAVELYREHADTIGVVLLDVRMPGLDGVQTLAAIRQLNPGVRCCFQTATPSDLEALGDLGTVCVLRKPVCIEKLVGTLCEALTPNTGDHTPP